MLETAKKKPRKLTDHGKQLLPRALISNVMVFYDKERIVGNDRYGRAAEGGVGGGGRGGRIFVLTKIIEKRMVKL